MLLSPKQHERESGRLLMQKLGLGQALLEFSHEEVGQPQMWHIWWHIGIRRYRWIKQQQQQHKRDGVNSRTTRSSSSSSISSGSDAGSAVAGLCGLMPAEVEELYLDPAARCGT